MLRFLFLALLAFPGHAFAQAQGTVTQTSVSCGSSSTTLLAANTAVTFLKIKNTSGAAATVWVNWTGVAAVAALPSEDLPAGTSIVWLKSQGFLPRTALTCISAGSAQSVLVEYQ